MIKRLNGKYFRNCGQPFEERFVTRDLQYILTIQMDRRLFGDYFDAQNLWKLLYHNFVFLPTFTPVNALFGFSILNFKHTFKGGGLNPLDSCSFCCLHQMKNELMCKIIICIWCSLECFRLCCMLIVYVRGRCCISLYSTIYGGIIYYLLTWKPCALSVTYIRA